MDTLSLARELIRRPSVSPADAGCQILIGGAARGRRASRSSGCGSARSTTSGHGAAAPRPHSSSRATRTSCRPARASSGTSDPFAATVRGDRLIGRGAADMKGSLAAMINACRAVRRATTRSSRARSACLITSDEEGAADDGTLKVMETLASRGETFQYCVVGEPSSAAKLGDTVTHRPARQPVRAS